MTRTRSNEKQNIFVSIRTIKNESKVTIQQTLDYPGADYPVFGLSVLKINYFEKLKK